MKILKILGVLLTVTLLLAIAVLYEGDIPADVIDAKYSNPASQFLDLGEQGRIHYRDEGNHRGTPVILLHGSNASLHTWEPWVQLMQDQYRIITLDLPAHGLTGAIPSGDYSYQSYEAVIGSLVEHLELKSYVLGGNSMGGAAAWRYGIDHQDQILALILMNTSGPKARSAPRDRRGPLAFQLLGQPWFRAIAVKLDPYYLVAEGLQTAYNHSPVVTDELIMRYYDLNLRAGTREATMLRFSQRSAGDYDLSEIRVPTLLVWGKEDAVVPFAFAEEFEQEINDVTTAYYDDVGHIPMEEIPERSARDVLAFLGQLKSSNRTEP